MDHLLRLFDTGPNGSAMLTTALPPEVCAVVDFHCDLCDLDILKHSDRCSALLASYASLASFSTTTNQRAIGGVDIYAPACIPHPAGRHTFGGGHTCARLVQRSVGRCTQNDSQGGSMWLCGSFIVIIIIIDKTNAGVNGLYIFNM